MAIDVVLELLKGRGGDAAKREDLLLGVDVDLDVGGGVGGWVAVPTYVEVAIEPRTLEVGGLVIVQLTLQSRDLALDLALLVQQPLHSRTLALGLIVHLITINHTPFILSNNRRTLTSKGSGNGRESGGLFG